MINPRRGVDVRLERLSLSYGSNNVLSDFSLQINPGEMLALLGPSGCGKTTVLKLIAGLAQSDQGDVRFDGKPVTDTPAERREVVLVFQKPLLFPHMNVAENIGFGLRMRKNSEQEIQSRVTEMLRLVQLEGYGARRPNELSGGQEQRVALARALVTRPRVLLLDEPFSALDETLRVDLRFLVRDLQRQTGVTTLFVTHDQSEAASLCDRIALLLGGRIEQIDAPRDFYLKPRTVASARFFGWQIINLELDGAGQSFAFRPERSRLLAPESLSTGGLTWKVRVLACADTGIRQRYRVALSSGEVVEVEMEGPELQSNFYPGAAAVLEVASESVLRFSQGA